MNDNTFQLLIYASTFFGIGLIVFLFCPKNFDEFILIISKQKNKKSGLLLLVSPILESLGIIIKKIPLNFIQKYLTKIDRWLISADLNFIF